MNNNHDIKDLDLLYEDAKKLINEIVTEKFDGDVIKSITSAMDSIANTWRGPDALVQTNSLIDVKNLLIDNREIVGNIGVYISMLAKNYRDAQNANAMILPAFIQLEYEKLEHMQNVSGNSTEVYMNNDALNTVTILNNTITSIEELNSLVTTIKGSIFNNWGQEDDNHAYAVKLFEEYSNNMVNIVAKITDVIGCINRAVENYNVSINNVSVGAASGGMPTLASMFEAKNDKVMKEYTPEEKKILGYIEENFASNKKITTDFNQALVNEVKKDLISKGVLK